MITVQIKPGTKVGLDEIVKGVSALDTADLENFLGEIANLLARRKAPHLSRRESELLLKINTKYPPALKERYNLLYSKLKEKIISTAEQHELTNITDQFEQLDAQRLEHLMELAQLRGISLGQLLLDTGLTPPDSHHA